MLRLFGKREEEKEEKGHSIMGSTRDLSAENCESESLGGKRVGEMNWDEEKKATTGIGDRYMEQNTSDHIGVAIIRNFGQKKETRLSSFVISFSAGVLRRVAFQHAFKCFARKEGIDNFD